MYEFMLYYPFQYGDRMNKGRLLSSRIAFDFPVTEWNHEAVACFLDRAIIARGCTIQKAECRILGPKKFPIGTLTCVNILDAGCTYDIRYVLAIIEIVSNAWRSIVCLIHYMITWVLCPVCWRSSPTGVLCAISRSGRRRTSSTVYKPVTADWNGKTRQECDAVTHHEDFKAPLQPHSTRLRTRSRVTI